MKPRFEEYSVGQLARVAGVSVRTLHHYDDSGLLKPAHVGANGYRLYCRAELVRLQEIMFYRDVGLSLDEVGRLLDGPANAVERLIRHRRRMTFTRYWSSTAP
jgi:DNA-binding transcriptional MerR regulator